MIISLLLAPIYYYLGIIWTFLLGGAIIAYILYMKKENSYFPENGIKALPTYFPFIGNTFKIFIQQEHFAEMMKRLYKTFPEEKYFGLRSSTIPMVVIKDLDIMKQVTIKDFDYFTDHVGQVDADVDPLFGSNLISLKGHKWKEMRATLSPAFTSSKMRGMFEFVNECGDQMTKYFLKEAQKPENRGKQYLEIEMKDLFTRYANDVIATTAFGITVNSHKHRENEFYRMGKKATNFSGLQLFKFFAFTVVPRAMKFFNVTVFDSEVSQFFRDLVNNTMKTREEKHIVRPDMIHLLMEAKKGSLKHEDDKTDADKDAGFATVEESDMGKQTIKTEWTNDEIVAQAIIFFFAGFETASSLLCFVGYELARNPDIQKKLQEEIDEVAEKNNGKLKYDDLTHMTYLDMVVCETLRLWPPGIGVDRKCIKPYTLPPSRDGQPGGKLNVGDGVWIPVIGIHHDPQYYENPEKFDPERFSDANKHKINPLAYLPFGMGPRNCIGSRFALMEVKSVVFNILRSFDFMVSEKTPAKFVFGKNSVSMVPKTGFWIGLHPRD